MDIRNKNRGFTLIELLVVIAIIGILASILTTNLNSAKQKATNAKFSLEANQIALAMQLYYDKNGDWPNCDGEGFLPCNCNLPCTPDFANPADPSNNFYPNWPANYGFGIFDFNVDSKPDIGQIYYFDSQGVLSYKYIPCITSDTYYFDHDYCGEIATP